MGAKALGLNFGVDLTELGRAHVESIYGHMNHSLNS